MRTEQARPVPGSIPFLTRLRYSVFRQLEKRATPTTGAALPAGTSAPALWVFVSTIGELNAIGPFLRQLVAQHAELRLVLLTDRSIYRESYLAQYPQADIVEIGASGEPAHALAQLRPPALFIVAEIPCLPADAPCRLPIGYLYAARAAGARLALVNGWLYGYAPACRMDSIERSLLGRDYLKLFDLLCVQTEEVARRLRAAGAADGQLRITGNIKFDALDAGVRPISQTRCPALLQSVEDSGRCIVVAGCVTDDEERELVLDAFTRLRQHTGNALLVLAPRHPEKPEVLRALRESLQLRALPYVSRSDGDEPLSTATDVVVLDTMGELRDFYARADVAHVGRDHNVLEPLAFGKPVTVRPGWDDTYPSFPVFQLAQQHRLIQVMASAGDLGRAWQTALGDTDSSRENIQMALEGTRGATQRTLAHVAQVSGMSR
ncbi:MAG: glycosyltransferase N-terminal domain-containing protein [Moraxellaceae bacterium]|nr:glycosyltransferase N-terminal domain-containing protein [Moraxellaceae bacterium]